MDTCICITCLQLLLAETESLIQKTPDGEDIKLGTAFTFFNSLTGFSLLIDHCLRSSVNRKSGIHLSYLGFFPITWIHDTHVYIRLIKIHRRQILSFVILNSKFSDF
jgi:hypothetical protein